MIYTSKEKSMKYSIVIIPASINISDTNWTSFTHGRFDVENIFII